MVLCPRQTLHFISRSALSGTSFLQHVATNMLCNPFAGWRGQPGWGSCSPPSPPPWAVACCAFLGIVAQTKLCSCRASLAHAGFLSMQDQSTAKRLPLRLSLPRRRFRRSPSRLQAAALRLVRPPVRAAAGRAAVAHCITAAAAAQAAGGAAAGGGADARGRRLAAGLGGCSRLLGRALAGLHAAGMKECEIISASTSSASASKQRQGSMQSLACLTRFPA